MTDFKPTTLPTVSRVLADGRLVELLYDAQHGETALAVAEPGGAIERVQRLELANGSTLTPYSADNTLIASGSVLLPSDVGDYTDKASLLKEVQAFLHRYVDLSPTFEAIAAHYVLLSWVYDGFSEVPYLRFRGDYGTGKTRALLTLGHLCYKAFFASGASTVSPIFHVLDAFAGTLVLDEADFRFSDATAPLTKILNNGTMRGLPVLRTMINRHKEFNPRAFQVYGPKLVAMRHGFADRALESRFLTEETGLSALRSDIPIQLPATLAPEALILRNKLLAWRFATLATVKADPSRLAPGVEPRLNQTTLSLLSLVDDPEVRASIHQSLTQEQTRLKEERAASSEGLMVRVLANLFADHRTTRVSVAAAAEAYIAAGGDRLGQPATLKWTGWFLRTKLRLQTTKSNGVFVIPASERPKLAALAARFGATDP
ncbi:MAG TPA: hypothetical protein VGL66_15165 [Caulobacteraceae bacterium]|jgi:hypothetical protein